MANHGKRMVKENLIAQIGQGGGGGTEYTAGTGIDITEDVISANIKAGSGIVVDTDLTDDSLVVMIDQEDIPYKSDLATVATTGDYDDLLNKPTIPTANDTAFIKLDYDKCVTTGPSQLDQTTITAWIKTLPIFVSTADDATTGTNSIKHYLVSALGFSEDNIYTHRYPGSMGYELTGYFALLKETTSAPFQATEFIIFTPESRTGTSTLVNRTNRNATRLFNVNNTRWRIVDAQYKGTNTSLSAYTDPVGVNITVYSKNSSVDRVMDIETKDTTVDPVRNQFVAFGYALPTGSEDLFVQIPNTDGVYLATKASNKLTFTPFADAPTVDGTYDLEATVSDGVVTYTWVART